MSGTWATGWATNDIVTAAEFAKGVGCVADTTLGGSAASINLTGLPTTYAHLVIVAYLRSDTVAVGDPLLLRFNGDTAANYDWQRLTGNNATASAGASVGQTSIRTGFIAAASSGANRFGAVRIEVPFYGGTANDKTVTAISGFADSTAANSQVEQNSGIWRSTAAITQVTVLCAGNLLTGSRLGVYVMGA